MLIKPYRGRMAWLLAGLWLVVPSLAPAQQTSVKPGINAPYVDPDLDDSIKRFEGESREVFKHREAIVAACDLKPGMVVADVGAGTGLFSRLMAPRVLPGGKVLAVDLSKKFVEHVLDTARAERITNIEGVVSGERSVKLPSDSVDLVFVCDTYHHFEFPVDMLASIHAALRPEGRLVVVDYQREPGQSPEWVLGHVRAGKQQVLGEIEAAGFRLLHDPPLMQGQYLLCFRRTATKAIAPR